MSLRFFDRLSERICNFLTGGETIENYILKGRFHYRYFEDKKRRSKYKDYAKILLKSSVTRLVIVHSFSLANRATRNPILAVAQSTTRSCCECSDGRRSAVKSQSSTEQPCILSLALLYSTGLGCSNAIYSVRKVVNHYINGGSTVNMCTIDLSKAFDKMNHSALF